MGTNGRDIAQAAERLGLDEGKDRRDLRALVRQLEARNRDLEQQVQCLDARCAELEAALELARLDLEKAQGDISDSLG